MRMGLVISDASDRDNRVAQRADALDGAFDDVARPHEFLRRPACADPSGGAGREISAINWLILNSMKRVLLFCFSKPFTWVRILRLCGSPISSAVTMHGPIGAKLSCPFDTIHCPARRQSRADTSLMTV